MNRDTIRQVLMQHGFTIKPGCADLKPYVYEAVEAVLALATQPAVWVGLTDYEQAAAWYGQSGHHPEYLPAKQRNFVRAIEAKLREKNGGAA